MYNPPVMNPFQTPQTKNTLGQTDVLQRRQIQSAFFAFYLFLFPALIAFCHNAKALPFVILVGFVSNGIALVLFPSCLPLWLERLCKYQCIVVFLGWVFPFFAYYYRTHGISKDLYAAAELLYTSWKVLSSLSAPIATVLVAYAIYQTFLTKAD